MYTASPVICFTYSTDKKKKKKHNNDNNKYVQN